MDNPMFVGEVRMKISRVGVSWTLSGGNQEVGGPTKSSKYLHVLRATARRNRRSSDVSVPPRQLFAGRLITLPPPETELPRGGRGLRLPSPRFPATPRRR